MQDMAAEEDKPNDEPVVMMMESNIASRDKFLKYVQLHPLENPLGFSIRGAKNDTLFFNFPSYINHQITIKINRISMDVSLGLYTLYILFVTQCHDNMYFNFSF